MVPREPDAGSTSPARTEAALTKALLHGVREGVLVVAAAGEIVFANEAWSRILGIDPQNLPGRTALDYVHPDDTALMRDAWESVAQTGGVPVHVRIRARHHDRTWRWLEVTMIDRRDDVGVAGVVIMALDVTTPETFRYPLTETDRRFRILNRFSNDAVLVVDADVRITFVSATVERVMGFTPAELTGADGLQFVHPDHMDQAVSRLAAALDSPGQPVTVDLPVLTKHGGYRWAELTGTNMLHDPDVNGIVVTYRDITDRVQAEGRLRQLGWAVESSADIVCIARPDGTPVYLNEAACIFFGVDDTDGFRLEDRRWVTDESRSRFSTIAAPVLRQGEPWTGELEFVRHDGEIVTMAVSANGAIDSQGHLESMAIIGHDISVRHRMQNELERRASHDPLTGLPNRTRFMAELDGSLREHDHRDRLAVMFIDLDDFKVVNDSLGHAAGDEALGKLATRIASVLRGDDTIARYGGDEFVVLSRHVGPDLSRAVAVARRIEHAVEEPLALAGHEVVVRASIGIALADKRRSASEVIHNADAAMYRAKAARTGIEIYDDTYQSEINSRDRFEQTLRRSAQEDEIDILYQPRVSVATGKITGVEALSRWSHAQLGAVPPSFFIEVAERTGSIIALGESVLRRACTEVATWDTSLGISRLSVNVSPRQMMHRDFVNSVKRVLDRTGLDADRLELEVTESLLIDDTIVTLENLRGLLDLGVRIALDDFGTGFSSLAYLRRFPVHTLKLDREFIANLGRMGSAVDEAIVASIIEIAGALGLVTVAEGVETVSQLSAVRALGFDEAQGFLLAPPMAAEDIGDFRLDLPPRSGHLA